MPDKANSFQLRKKEPFAARPLTLAACNNALSVQKDKVDSLKKVSSAYQSQIGTLTKTKDSLLTVTKSFDGTNNSHFKDSVTIDSLTIANEDLAKTNDSLTTEIAQLQTKQPPVTGIFDSPYTCAVLIALIIAVAAVAIIKGFSISKGDTKVSIGDRD